MAKNITEYFFHDVGFLRLHWSDLGIGKMLKLYVVCFNADLINGVFLIISVKVYFFNGLNHNLL